MKPSEMASLSNPRWKNRKERPNRTTNNGDMAVTAKRYVICLWVREWVSPCVLLKIACFAGEVQYKIKIYDPPTLCCFPVFSLETTRNPYPLCFKKIISEGIPFSGPYKGGVSNPPRLLFSYLARDF